MDIEQILIIVASLLIGACIIAYIMKNWLWQRYNILRHPEKVIRIIILYPGNMKKTFYRLIPSDKQIKIDERIYIYDKDSTIQREGHKKIIPKPELHDKAFVYCDDKGDYVVCEGRRYDMNESFISADDRSTLRLS